MAELMNKVILIYDPAHDVKIHSEDLKKIERQFITLL